MTIPFEVSGRLHEIIEEGNAVATLVSSPAWPIIKRTALAQIENYKQDCFDAAKDATKDIRAYLGRMEGIEWLIQTIESRFIEERNRALEELHRLEEEERAQNELDKNVRDGVSMPMFQPKPGMI